MRSSAATRWPTRSPLPTWSSRRASGSGWPPRARLSSATPASTRAPRKPRGRSSSGSALSPSCDSRNGGGGGTILPGRNVPLPLQELQLRLDPDRHAGLSRDDNHVDRRLLREEAAPGGRENRARLPLRVLHLDLTGQRILLVLESLELDLDLLIDPGVAVRHVPEGRANHVVHPSHYGELKGVVIRPGAA